MLKRLICIALIGLLSSQGEPCRAESPDKLLVSSSIAAAIHAQLGTSVSVITNEQLASITELNLDDFHHLDLTGLSTLSNLNKLSLNGNALSDLSPIATLTSLTHLTLSNNRISDLVPLASLTDLVTLNLNNNLIIDCSPLSKLFKLQNLSMNENAIENISSLKNLSRLRSLHVGENRITTLVGIHNLKALSDFRAPGNSLTSTKALTGLKSLNILDISENRIKQLDPLSKLTNIRILKVDNNPIRSITPLSTLSNLTHFSMKSSRFNGNLNSLTKLPNLTHLSCTNSQLKNITPLKHATKLSVLNLQRNNIEDIRGLIESRSPLKTINLTTNPLGTLALTFHIPALLENAKVLFDGHGFDSSMMLYSSFKKIDENADSQLSFKEARTFATKLELDEFDALDTNHDFKITINELSALRVVLPNSMSLVWVSGQGSRKALGTRTSPFDSLKKASHALKDGGTIVLTPGTTLIGMTLAEPMRLTVPDDAEKPGRIIGVEKPSEPTKEKN